MRRADRLRWRAWSVARTKDKLRAVTEEHMAELARQPERVCAYFGDPRVKHAD